MMKTCWSRLGSCVVAIAIAVGSAGVALAEDWFFLAESDVDIKFFLDRASITRKGAIAGVKTFEVYPKADEDGWMAVLVQREYHCTDKKSRTQQVQALFEDGSIRLYREPTDWTSIDAKTIDDLILQQVCRDR